MREIVNGIFYVMRAGCPWRLLPNDLPPWGTIYRWFAAWRDDGCFERINHALVMADRERVGRDASPTAANNRPRQWQVCHSRTNAYLPDANDTALLIRSRPLLRFARLGARIRKSAWLGMVLQGSPLGNSTHVTIPSIARGDPCASLDLTRAPGPPFSPCRDSRPPLLPRSARRPF